MFSSLILSPGKDVIENLKQYKSFHLISMHKCWSIEAFWKKNLDFSSFFLLVTLHYQVFYPLPKHEQLSCVVHALATRRRLNVGTIYMSQNLNLFFSVDNKNENQFVYIYATFSLNGTIWFCVTKTSKFPICGGGTIFSPHRAGGAEGTLSGLRLKLPLQFQEWHIWNLDISRIKMVYNMSLSIPIQPIGLYNLGWRQNKCQKNFSMSGFRVTR